MKCDTFLLSSKSLNQLLHDLGFYIKNKCNAMYCEVYLQKIWCTLYKILYIKILLQTLLHNICNIEMHRLNLCLI